jgi:hypothetical protein
LNVQTFVKEKTMKTTMSKEKNKSSERAKAMREAFRDGATVKELQARYHFANTGVVGNILCGRTCPDAGGPIVKSVRREKEKKAKAPKSAKPKKAAAPKAAPKPRVRPGPAQPAEVKLRTTASAWSESEEGRIAYFMETEKVSRATAIGMMKRERTANEKKAAAAIPAPAAPATEKKPVDPLSSATPVYA